MTHPQRVQLLLELLAWTLLWALLVGQKLQQRKPISIKNMDEKLKASFDKD